MNKAIEDGQVLANTIVPCPKWCVREHTIDSRDSSGVHQMAPVELANRADKIVISMGWGFGNDGTGLKHDRPRRNGLD